MAHDHRIVTAINLSLGPANLDVAALDGSDGSDDPIATFDPERIAVRKEEPMIVYGEVDVNLLGNGEVEARIAGKMPLERLIQIIFTVLFDPQLGRWTFGVAAMIADDTRNM